MIFLNSELSDKLSKRKTYIIILSILMYCLGMSATDIYISSLPQIAIEFNGASKLINMTISIYYFGIATSILFVGEISNRYGRKIVLLFGVLIFSIAAIFIALAKSIIIIIILRFIQAVGCSIMIIIPRLIFKDFMHMKDQLSANALLLMGLVLATSFSPVVGAYIANSYTWRGCFVLSFIIGMILFFTCNAILIESNTKRIKQFRKINNYLETYWRISIHQNFLMPVMVYSTNIAAYFVFIGISSYLYIVVWKEKPEVFTFVYILMSGAYLLGNLTMQFLNKRYYTLNSMIRIGVVFNLLGVVLLLITFIINTKQQQMISLTSGVILIRFASAIIAPSIQVLLLERFKQNTAEALGLNIFYGFIASGIAIYIGGFFIHYPLNGIILLTSMFSIISILTYFYGSVS